MEFASFNINSYVYLEMKHSDFVLWKEHYDRYLPESMQSDLSYYRNKADKETGFVSMQMHEYMKVFGPHIGLGNPVPCGTTLRFNTKDIQIK